MLRREMIDIHRAGTFMEPLSSDEPMPRYEPSIDAKAQSLSGGVEVKLSTFEVSSSIHLVDGKIVRAINAIEPMTDLETVRLNLLISWRVLSASLLS